MSSTLTTGIFLEVSHNWYWPSLEWSVVAKAACRFNPCHFREFGSVDLIGKAPGPNPVVRKFLMQVQVLPLPLWKRTRLATQADLKSVVPQGLGGSSR